ncbi:MULTISPECIES: hypothetical protein [Bacillus]|uniref:hypothetical protein n=1 Tax=Bacillus TaxID=1386 RepID=UPI00030CE80C|nr:MULTISPECIES: hypothetical protein [Bacillus]
MLKNEQNDLPFSVSLSIGHSISNENECKTMSALIKKADDSMYGLKILRKNVKKAILITKESPFFVVDK